MRKCKECGNDQFNGTLFCGNCGCYLLHEISGTHPLFDLSTNESFKSYRRTPASAAFPFVHDYTARLVFVIPSSGRQVEIEMDKTIRVGRSDYTRDIDPELDLTEDQGMEYGVSREHALLQPGNLDISLIDLGSTNGTHLNSRRLPPNEPYPLGDGDTIKFGQLLVQVFFGL
jgi:hypothetical protein